MRKILFQSLFLVCFLGVLWFIAAPKAAIYLNNRGMDRYNDGKFEEAVKYLKHSLQLNPKSAITHFNLGNAYIEIKREDDAIAEYKNAIGLDSHLAQAYRALSRVYADRALFEEAITTLKKSRSINPSDDSSDGLLDQVLSKYAQACLDKGAEAYLGGNKDEGYQLLKRAIELRPELPYPYYTIAGFYYSDGEYSAAEAALNSALQIDDNFFPAHKLLGDVYFAQGKLAKAHGHYMKALTADDSDPGLYHSLGLALMGLERYSEALPYLRRAVELAPQNANMLYSLASVYRDSGQFQDAIREYSKLLAVQPDHPNVHNDLGDIYHNLGRENDALLEYRKEIELCDEKLAKAPQHPVFLNDLAYAYNGIGETQKAREIIEKVIVSWPKYSQAHFTSAKIYEKAGKIKESIAALEKAKGSFAGNNFIDREIGRMKAIAPDK